jgi:hypothetical protein
MPKFAVYYVPEERDELYRLGSSVVGYDIRKRKTVQTLEELRHIPGFTDHWVQKARPHGFHLTIGDSIDFELGKISEIQNEISELLGCFNPEHKFALRRRHDDFVAYWGSAVVLRYDPNDHLKVLHALIAALIDPIGTGSGYLRRHLDDPERESTRPYRINRTLKFYSPMIFDSYAPHFTLLHPHTGESREELTRLFSNTFARFDEVVLGSLSLLVQLSEEENWRIYREFTLT